MGLLPPYQRKELFSLIFIYVIIQIHRIYYPLSNFSGYLEFPLLACIATYILTFNFVWVTEKLSYTIRLMQDFM